MSKRLLRLVALLAGLSLIAAACGGSSTEDEASTEAADSTEEESSTEAEEEVGGAADDDATAEAMEEAAEGEAEEASGAASIEDLEAEWTARRAEIVADIKANGYGVDPDTNILTGPAGMEIDLNNCPSDWSDTGGVVDGTVKIGHTIAQSGSLAAYGNITFGMGAYFDYVNENGGIGPDGLQIELLAKDDEYVATKTQELVDELLQTEDPFYITTLGSPNTFSVQPKLNELCVPQPMVQTGHQAWGDPDNNPWTTGLQLSYAAEALLWGSWIEQNLSGDAPITVAALVMDNDFGLAYEQGFDRFVEASDVIEKVEFVRHDPAAATLTNEVTTLAAENADVFISMTAGNPCLLAIQEAARAGITTNAKAVFTPSVCKAVSSYMAPAEDAAEGWYIIGGGWKDNTDPQYVDDVYISWMNQLIDDAGLDSNNSLVGSGVGQFGWSQVEALRIAAELDGGLTRTNLMLAVRSLDVNHPALLEGIDFSANGAEDAYLVEGSDVSKFDAASQTWVQQGGVIDLNGQSTNCAWVAGEGC